MVAPRNRKHILVSKEPRVDPYTPHGGGGPAKTPGAPSVGRPAHAATLRASLEQAARDAVVRRTTAGMAVRDASPGVYVEFEAVPGWDLAISSLEHTTPKDPFKRILLRQLVNKLEHLFAWFVRQAFCRYAAPMVRRERIILGLVVLAGCARPVPDINAQAESLCGNWVQAVCGFNLRCGYLDPAMYATCEAKLRKSCDDSSGLAVRVGAVSLDTRAAEHCFEGSKTDRCLSSYWLPQSCSMFSILTPKGRSGDRCVSRFGGSEWSDSCAEGYCPAGDRMCSACTTYDFARLGEPCSRTRYCDGRIAYCDDPEDGGPGECSVLREGGEPCAEDRECASAQCRGDGGCLTHGLPTGAACTDSQECASFECASGRCFDGSDAGADLPVGSPCTIPWECGVSTTCTAGHCSTLPGEGMPCPSGQFSFACADGLRCDLGGVCRRPGRLGEPCSVSWAGQSMCGKFLHCDDHGSCAAGARMGEACDGRTGCSEGYCQLAELEGVGDIREACSGEWLCQLRDGGFGNGVCAPLLPPGAPCLFESSCAEGFCPYPGGNCPQSCPP